MLFVSTLRFIGENTQAVATTPVALRLLALGGKRLVTRLLGLKGEWVRCRRVQP